VDRKDKGTAVRENGFLQKIVGYLAIIMVIFLHHSAVSAFYLLFAPNRVAQYLEQCIVLMARGSKLD